MPPDTSKNDIHHQPNVINHEQFQAMIKAGDSVFIYESQVYRVNRFIEKHPGGAATITSALGRDVTDEIRSLHPPEVYNKMLRHYRIGDYLGATHPQTTAGPNQSLDNFEPQTLQVNWSGKISLEAYDRRLDELFQHHAAHLAQDGQTQTDLDKLKIRKAYRQLEEEMVERGLFECNYWRYAKEGCRYLTFLFLSLWFTLRGYATWHYMVGAVCLACFWHQITFTAHDAGHNAITGVGDIDHRIGVLIANYIGGLSLGWWKDNHNVHHIVTNHPEHDPDIQHIPFMAITTRFFQHVYSTYYKRVLPFDQLSRFFIRRQHYLYYLILSFGRFNLHRLSFLYLFSKGYVRTRTFEIVGIVVFFSWFGALLSSLPNWQIKTAYVFVSYMLTFPLHVQITLSHFGMSTDDKGPDEPFPAKMLRTTMDVDCPEWFDWFHGGLQYQAVHHLYPRLPRHNLRTCVPLVKEFCNQQGLHYYMYDFSTGNGVVLGALKAVADQVDLMNQVAKSNATVWAGEKINFSP